MPVWFVVWFAVAQGGCLSEAPKRLDKSRRLALCASDAPGAARCAKAAFKLHLDRTLNDVGSIVDLCAQASTEAPAECAGTLSVSDAERVRLCAGAAGGTAACLKVAATHSTLEELEVLCGDAETYAPGKCFVSALADGWSRSGALSLCRGASNEIPARCVRSRSMKRLLEAEARALCVGATRAEGPGECLSSAPKTVDAIALCAAAVDASPAECARSALNKAGRQRQAPTAKIATFCKSADKQRASCMARPSKDLETSMHLCSLKGNHALGHAECEKRARQGRLSIGLAASLCSGATSAAAGQCAVFAPYEWSATAKSMLCETLRFEANETLAEVRGRCGRAAARAIGSSFARTALGQESTERIAARTCSRAIDTSPAECLAQAPKGWHVSDAVSLCKRSVGESAAAYCAKSLIGAFTKRAVRQLAPVDVASLCSGANGVESAAAIVECAISAASSGNLVVQLCSASDAPAIAAATECFKATSLAHSMETRIHVCAGAPASAPTGPAACFGALRTTRRAHRLGDDEAVALCRGAATPTPAYCAAASSRHILTECRTVESVPTSLRLETFSYDGAATGEPLVAQQNFIASLAILDQFGRPMNWPSDPEVGVVASIPLANSGGAVLLGRRYNSSINGVVRFDYLRLSQPGSFTLNFAFAGDTTSLQKPAASALLKVQSALNDASLGFVSPAGKCGAALVSTLRCGAHQGPLIRDSSATAMLMAFLPPTALALGGPLDGCEDVLRHAGFQIDRGWRGTAWVRYRQALAWIEADLHPNLASEQNPRLPKANMPPLDRLSINSPTPSRNELKKAYYRLSLDWHPDRWVAFPAYRAHAQTIFALIGDAYESLADASSL